MPFSPDTTLPVAVIEAANYTSTRQSKGYILLHDVECPPGTSWAEALASGYFANPATKASTQYIVDADSIVAMVPEDEWAWGSGSPSSRHAIHIEQAGYASFTTPQWLGLPSAVGTSYQRPDGTTRTYTADDASSMRSQFVLVARLMADICQRRGWTATAATKADLLREVQGENLGRHIRHVDARDWVGGTTHHDPGTSYPWEYLLTQVTAALAGRIPNPDPSAPTTQPTSPEEDDDMATNDAVLAEVKQARAELARIRQVLSQLPTSTAAVMRTITDQIDDRSANLVIAKLRDAGVIGSAK